MRTAAIALALAAFATPVLADSAVWMNIAGPINSRGLTGDANNAVVVTNPIPPLPAGSLGWSYITITGNLNRVNANTFASEACIEVTGPTGLKSIIKPFENGSFAGTIPVPAGAATQLPNWLTEVGQTCTLRFYELYADSPSGPDATWSNVTLTLHSETGNTPDPEAFSAEAQVTAVEPDWNGNAVYLYKGSSPAGTLTFFNTRIVSRYRLRSFGTAMSGWASNNSNSPLHSATFNITAQKADGSGPVTWSVTPYADFAASSKGVDMTLDTPVPVKIGPGSGWDWSITESGAPLTNGTRYACIWFSVQPLAGAAPNATDLGTIRGKPTLGPAETTVVKTVTVPATPGSISWYTFTTEATCAGATGRWLDIHTAIPQGSTVADHELALYTGHGERIGYDDDGGSFGQSLMTFGDGDPVRAPIDPTGGPFPRDGHHGTLLPGTYYLAVSQFYTLFDLTNWYVTLNTQNQQTGDIRVDFRTNLPPLPCGQSDVGGAGGQPGADGLLNNNDFIAFIDLFFAQNPLADMGGAGGLAPGDGHFDNNDFIVFIDRFFQGCV